MKKAISTLSTLILIIVLISTSCRKDDNGQLVDLHLNASPDTLVILDSDSIKEIFLSTQPKGAIEYTISQKPDWLYISPLNGTLNGNILSIKIRPVKDNLAEGIYKGKINIISNIAGTADVYVKMAVNGHPKIRTNLSAITFPENVSETELVVENIGTGILNWSINNTTKWITLSQTSGYLMKGEKNTLKITCNRIGLDVNTYTSSLTITSNSETLLQPLPISMTVGKTTAMTIHEKSLLFDYFVDNMNVYLKNTGNSTFNWNSSKESFFTLSPNNGSLPKGDSVKINIALNRASFETGIFKSNIFITNNDNGKDTIKTQINHFRNTKWNLNRNVVDAEFCRATNKIVIVSSNPNSISIIDPDLKTIESINLNSVPTCISINKNGDHAAVGHNGLVSFVNLNTKSIEKEYSVSCDPIDIVLTTSNWAYVFPVRDQWANIHCINLQNGAETLHTGNSIYAGTLAKLHPSEKWIYGANNGLSPSDIEKYSVESGTASYLYDSPYHGDYPMSGNIWFSEDGDRIFTKGKTVLKLSTDRANDMIYNGSVSCTDVIRTLFHSKIIDKFFVVTQSGYWSDVISASEVLVYNYSYLNYLTKYTLEPFMVPMNQTGGKLYNAEGNYVFVKNDGKKLYVIVEANKDSGLLNDWAIQTFVIQ